VIILKLDPSGTPYSSELNFDSELSTRAPSRRASKISGDIISRDSKCSHDISRMSKTSEMSSKTVTPNLTTTTTPNVSSFQPIKYLSCEDSVGVANPNFKERMYATLSRSASAHFYDNDTLPRKHFTGMKCGHLFT